jgi:WNK lysine deficient protein kinase
MAISPTGRYVRLPKVLGRGSFKIVYEGRNNSNGMGVAWCEILVSHLEPQELELVRDEIRYMISLDHIHVVSLLESWEDVDTICFVSERVGRFNLRELIFQPHIVATAMVGQWGRQILLGLEYLHSKHPPLIHRDIKCENIFMDESIGLVKIGDLGLAVRGLSKGSMGTLPYMAPEAFESMGTTQLDIWSFGMSMLELSTGHYPYHSCTTHASILGKIMRHVLPESLDEIADQECQRIVLWCLTIDPDQRPTARMLLDDPFFSTLTSHCGNTA